MDQVQNRQPVIAILDIGKTNKKSFLIDEHYRIVWEQSCRFQEVPDEDGDPCEDVKALSAWVQESLQEMLAMPQYEVKALNFSAYGASFVLTDQEGNVICPLYNYLKTYPADLRPAVLPGV